MNLIDRETKEVQNLLAHILWVCHVVVLMMTCSLVPLRGILSAP